MGITETKPAVCIYLRLDGAPARLEIGAGAPPASAESLAEAVRQLAARVAALEAALGCPPS